MSKWLRRWGLCTRGQGLIEYALILGLVAIALTSVLLLLRNSTENTYTGVGNNLGQLGIETGSGVSTGGNGNHGGGNGNGNHGNGNGNGGGDGSNGQGRGQGTSH